MQAFGGLNNFSLLQRLVRLILFRHLAIEGPDYGLRLNKCQVLKTVYNDVGIGPYCLRVSTPAFLAMLPIAAS